MLQTFSMWKSEHVADLSQIFTTNFIMVYIAGWKSTGNPQQNLHFSMDLPWKISAMRGRSLTGRIVRDFKHYGGIY